MTLQFRQPQQSQLLNGVARMLQDVGDIKAAESAASLEQQANVVVASGQAKVKDFTENSISVPALARGARAAQANTTGIELMTKFTEMLEGGGR